MPERKIRMDTQEILLQFKNGQMSLEEAEGYLKRQPFEEMGYAKLDSHRKLRSGFAEGMRGGRTLASMLNFGSVVTALFGAAVMEIVEVSSSG